jgi:hypothetical protein
LLLSSLLRCFLVRLCGAMLTSFCLLLAGVGALRPRQVQRPRPDERRAPPALGAARRSRRARRGPEDPGRLVGVPCRGSARPALGAGGATHGACFRC